MRCLVTGATGHLGSFLARLLVAEGHEVAALVRPTSDLWRIEDLLPQLTLVRGDLSAIDEAAPAIVAARPETVFHLGWYGVTSEYRDDPRQITQNLQGSLRLLEIAHSAGARCWVGLGSQAEYGPYNGVLDEQTPTRPITTYGVTKLSLCLLTRQLCASLNMRYVWLRLLATYGPKDDERHLIPSVIVKLLAGQRPALTSGEQRWDYLYVEDAAAAVAAVALTEAEGVFMLGSGQTWSVRRIVEHLRDQINPALPLGFGELPYGVGQIMHLEANVARLQHATGWAPTVALDAGLARTVAWYQAERGERI